VEVEGEGEEYEEEEVTEQYVSTTHHYAGEEQSD
jgi:hypothetical protein